MFISAAGDALLRAAGDITEIWLMPKDAKRCPFTKKGTIPAGEGSLGRVTSSGRVARATYVEDEPMIEVWNPNEKQPQVWPMSGCTSINDPEWLDETHFAVTCDYRPPEPVEDFETGGQEEEPEPEAPTEDPIPRQTWLYFASTETGEILAWPAWQLGDGVYKPTIHHRPHPHMSILLDMSVTRVELLTATTDVKAFFAAPPKDEAAAAAGVRHRGRRGGGLGAAL